MLGGLLALLLMLAEPWLFLFLAGFFALGNAATRAGFARKQARGIAEARGGRRGAAEVFGAMGMAAWMTPLAHLADPAHSAPAADAAPEISAHDAAKQSELNALHLARVRVLADLQRACRPAHRGMLEAALADVEARITAVRNR